MAVMQTVLEEPSLSSERLYAVEMTHLPPRLWGEEEQAMLAQARAGDPSARSYLVETCLPYVVKLARRFAILYENDYLDLVAQGNLLLLSHLDYALAASENHPQVYLFLKVRYGFIEYCYQRQTLITMPSDRHGGKLKPWSIASLEKPIIKGKDRTLVDTIADTGNAPSIQPAKTEADYTALYRAIETVLTERQRDVILRYYGLCGYAQQNLYEISALWCGNKRKGDAEASHTKAAALKKQRIALADTYPQFCSDDPTQNKQTNGQALCRFCEKPFQIKETGRPPMYCSKRCNDKASYWRHRGKQQQEDRLCQYCEQRFQARTLRPQWYCSARCRDKAFRRNQREKRQERASASPVAVVLQEA